MLGLEPISHVTQLMEIKSFTGCAVRAKTDQKH